jgi:hypothetical protein
MNIRQGRRPNDTAQVIAWQDCEADLRVAQKTRRAVRDEVISTVERRKSQRRNLGIAMFAFALLLVLLAPAIWNGLEDLFAGEHIFDLPTVIAFSALMLFSAMLAALIAFWKGQRKVEHDRGGIDTFRPIQK